MSDAKPYEAEEVKDSQEGADVPIGFKTELLEEENDRLKAELAAVVERCAVAGERAVNDAFSSGRAGRWDFGITVRQAVTTAIRAAGRGNG